MGHGQHHVALVFVLEATHLRADCVPTPRLLPEFGWMHHRHGDFLAADGVYLVADNVLDLAHGPLRQGQIAEDTTGQWADKAGPQQELMAGDFHVGSNFAQGLAEKPTHSHVGFPFFLDCVSVRRHILHKITQHTDNKNPSISYGAL